VCIPPPVFFLELCKNILTVSWFATACSLVQAISRTQQRTSAHTLYRQDSDLAGRAGGFVEITCADCSLFKQWTTEEYRTVLDSLAEGHARVVARTMTKTRFSELEQSVGLNYNPHGILYDAALRPHLRPLEIGTYDWVHTVFQGGVFSVEAQLFLTEIATIGIERVQVQTFLGDDRWSFPRFTKVKASQLHRIFDPRRESSDNPNKVKGTASELLGLYGLLRHFVEVYVADEPAIRTQRQSFDALCEWLDLLIDVKRGLVSPLLGAPRLRTLGERQLQLHLTAYGTEAVLPKHHWFLDLPQQLERDGCVIDAFVIERQHLTVKGVAEHIKNTIQCERSVMASLCTLTSNLGREATFGSGLTGKTLMVSEGFWVARHMNVAGFTASLEDVVLGNSGSVAGIVLACCIQGDVLCAIVDVLSPVNRVCRHARSWRLAGHREVWPATDLEQCLAWYSADDGSWVVVER
jgi:hypothetical protein